MQDPAIESVSIRSTKGDGGEVRILRAGSVAVNAIAPGGSALGLANVWQGISACLD